MRRAIVSLVVVTVLSLALYLSSLVVTDRRLFPWILIGAFCSALMYECYRRWRLGGPPGECRRCRYDLTGLSPDRHGVIQCPECGTTVAVEPH